MSGSPAAGRRIKYLAVLAIALFASAAVAGFYSYGLDQNGSTKDTTSSPNLGDSSTTTSSACATAPVAENQQLAPTTFGAITEFTVSANRTPAGIAVNQTDGSIWFGEWGLPGVGHLFLNGTLTEYKWPYADNSVTSECGQETQIWGVALWNGSVWAADNLYSRLIAVNPSTGATQAVNLTSQADPYTLAVGAGDLWFTEDTAPGAIGKLSPDSSVQYYSLPDSEHMESIYVMFQNSTLGYVLSLDETTFSPVLFSFDPSSATPTFTPAGGNQTLYEPSGLALANGGIWATEHAASAMAFLNFTTDQWTIYPTSTEPYVPTVLTYFDGSNGTAVWFNEHYTNRMGVITGDGRYLTEYSITNPPIWNITTILENYNMVTMGLDENNGAWFAAATAGIVGFVNASYQPPFSISAGSTSVTLAPGGSAQLGVQYTGNVAGSNLSLQFEDNEFNNGTAKFMSFTPGTITTSSAGVSTFTLTVSASSALAPGNYIAAATVTNGSIYRTVYFAVEVS
jgi:streptogramin lyase